MSPQLAALQAKLREIFEFDHAEDLDFGIYRILNLKREQTTLFLNELLEKYVKDAFKPFEDKTKARIQTELDELEKQAKTLGIKPQDIPAYQEKQKQLLSAVDTQKTENEVYAHLTEFFGRYYDSGDFISLRRYKKDVYAIPYEGEEVKLHWSNADQYYIKTTEYLSNYSFVAGGKKVTFKLAQADADATANNKVSKEKERVFRLSESPISFGEGVGGEVDGLLIYFTFSAKQTKDETQAKLLDEAFETLKAQPELIEQFPELFYPAPTDKNKNRTVLEKHLSQYTARNTRDFFIHKNLEKFLSQELDFYLKNEVMFIDDLDTEKEVDVQVYLSKVKVIKRIGLKIIAMLAQVENFQKRLWLKKKFVLQSDWCFTLDRVPESYYPEILKNQKQIQAWIKLFWIQEIETTKAKDLYSKDTIGFAEVFDKEGNLLSGNEGIGFSFLKENLNLLLDTVFFTSIFKYQLLANQENLDEKADGLLVHSENFQALRLLENRYHSQADCIYIDPPYNADSSKILYKNNFEDSSWISLMDDRISVSKSLLHSNSVKVVAIDETEQLYLGMLLKSLFSEKIIDCITVQHNPTGQQSNNFSYTHEFAYFIHSGNGIQIGLEDRSDNPDIRPLRNVSKGSHLRTDAANCFYPIFVKDGKVIGFGDVSSDDFHPSGRNVIGENGVIEIYPIDNDKVERKWTFARKSVEEITSELVVEKDKAGVFDIIRHKRKFTYKTVWHDSKYSANSWGSVILNNILPDCLFTYPKSIFTVRNSIDASLKNAKKGLTIDYFSGSGTTGHAVINLNREDQGTRKYILVEMGEYFDSVTKPRIQKVVYSPDWKDGKPTTRNKPFSHAFKYLRLESYEDTLTNLAEAGAQLAPSAQQQALLAKSPALKEDYLLRYALDLESREPLLPQSLFDRPWDAKLSCTRDNAVMNSPIDMPETFNYLLGLVVRNVRMSSAKNAEGISSPVYAVEGQTLSGQQVLVLWRNLIGTDALDSLSLNTWFQKMYDLPKRTDFDVIYVNGDTLLPNVKFTQSEQPSRFKVNLLESEFARLMWEGTD